MPSFGVLTSEDLDEIGQSAFNAGEPLRVVTDLVEAVDQGRVADKADIGYALLLAAEVTEQAGDLDGALALAERSVEADRVHGDGDYGYPRAFRAGLLLRLGREDEGLVELAGLRHLLTQDPDAVSYVSEALEGGGRAEIAEQWLSAALLTALERREVLAQHSDDPAYSQAAAVAFALAQQRHRVRRDLDLPHDEYDDLADRLADAVDEVLEGEHGGDVGTAVLFWPQMEFDELLRRWPVLAQAYGQTWDEHRGKLERGLQLWSESGVTGLAVLAGSAEGSARYAVRHGGDATDPDVRQGYAEDLQAPEDRSWPPGRNEACWCGSGLKYKKCCLPRSRT